MDDIPPGTAFSSSRNASPLIMPQFHSRRPSQGSSSSVSDDLNLAVDPSAALILVQDPEDGDGALFDPSDDDDYADQDSPQFDVHMTSIPPMPPSLVFLYLLAPLLKFGAMLLLHMHLPLKYGLTELMVFAAMSIVARQVWFMLARYLRKSGVEDVILDTFARERGRESQRDFLRLTVKACTAAVSLLLASTYLRESVLLLSPLLPYCSTSPYARPVVTVILGLFILVISSVKSLASKPIIYTTWLSILTYLIWLGFSIYAYTRNILKPSISTWSHLGILWQGITVIAFAFSSSSTIALYVSVKGFHPYVATTKTPHSRIFRYLSTFSIVVATVLMLPAAIISSFPHSSVSSSNFQGPSEHPVNHVIQSFSALTLLLGIPSIFVVTPHLRIPERLRRWARFSLSKFITWVLIILLSLTSGGASSITSDVLLSLSLLSTYALPTSLHIYAHFFKRPLAIVVPQIPGTPLTNTSSPPQRSVTDELLQRKEHALQRRLWRRRIVWDVGVWALFLLSVGGLTGAVGRVLGKW